MERMDSGNKRCTIFEIEIYHKEAQKVKLNSNVLRLFVNNKDVSVSIYLYGERYPYLKFITGIHYPC